MCVRMCMFFVGYVLGETLYLNVCLMYTCVVVRAVCVRARVCCVAPLSPNYVGASVSFWLPMACCLCVCVLCKLCAGETLYLNILSVCVRVVCVLLYVL